MAQAAGATIAAGQRVFPAAGGGTFARLLRFALANIRRQPERSGFAVAGIALAITAVVVVRTIAAGYQVSGVDALDAAIGGAPYWVVPDGGVRFDPQAGTIATDAPPPDVGVPAGWTGTTVLSGRLPGRDDVALRGSTGAAGTAAVTDLAARRLGLRPGDTLTVGGTALPVSRTAGAGALVVVPLAVAVAAGLRAGWRTLSPPAGRDGTPEQVAAATGLRVVSDPAQRPAAGSRGLVYQTTGGTSRAALLDFRQKFAAVFGGRVASSILGLVAQVGLVLGFVLAVTSFAAAVHERRREFGIMASIGLTDEVLYFFLVESAVVFLAAYLLGAGLGGLVVGLALPSFFSLGAWLSAAGLVATYVPALAIVAALVPVHRLLQQRPVKLLADA
jgi:putative ABC transport system permease protein